MRLLKNIDKYYLFSIFFIIVLILSTNHYSYDEALSLNQLDSKSYYLISSNYPNILFESDIPYHHYQRFLVPYIIGLLSDLTGLSIFHLYKLFVIITLVFISILHKKIFYKIGYNFELAVVFLSMIIFSPYLSRYIVSIPMMLVDLVFVLICYVIILQYYSKSKLILALIPFSHVFRLTGLGILVSYIISTKIIWKKDYYKIIVITFFSFIIIYILSKFANISTGSKFNNSHYLGIFSEISQKNSINLLFFTLKPLLIFLPLIIFLIFSKFNSKKIFARDSIFLLLTSLMFVGQPILGGEMVTGNNIFRLSSLSLPFLIFWVAKYFKPKFELKKFYLYIIIFNFLFSLHPTYSLVSYFR